MMKKSQSKSPLLDILQAAKLLPEDTHISTTKVPSFVTLLHGFSGWLASAFLLGSMGAMLVPLFKTPLALIVAGIALIAMGHAILTNAEKNIFGEQFAISVSLAGQAMVGFGLSNIFGSALSRSSLPWYLFALFELVVVYLIPNHLHRYMSAFVFAYSFLMGASISGFDFIGLPMMTGVAAWIWFTEYKHHEFVEFKIALGYGIALALFVWYTILHFPIYFYNQNYIHATSQYKYMINIGLNIAILLYIVRTLSKNSPSQPLKILSVVFALIIGVASAKVSGLVAGVGLLIIGYARGNYTLSGVSMAFLIWLVSRFYYTLQTTLLVKSIYLVSMGTVLLILYALFRKFVLSNEETGSLS